ncbi:hypothetical protein [Ralstonia pickettii]|uniref:hypothetical protein n=1 Tax=Ralstonia pickettii TaxID=329 RepID=UPI0015BD8E00|nr:hypothetical protein [Ralstonia pickettii]NWK44859.1 hypothetical protein [Ralstonia pickettii]
MTNNLLLWSCAAVLFFGMWWLLYRAGSDALQQIRSRAVTWQQSAPFALSMVVACGGCLSFLLWALTGGRTGGGLGALLLAAVALVVASLLYPLREP